MFIGCYALPPLLPYNYSDLDYFALQQPPSTDHWFGTNGSVRICWPKHCAACRSRC